MLVGQQRAASLYTDRQDFEVVRKTARLFSDDVQRVTGKSIAVSEVQKQLTPYCLIAGTLGHNSLIDRLVAEKKLDVSNLRGKWESYHIALLTHAIPNVERALIIVGSDRRGTAYGLLSLSETIGVSPWYWWADVPVARRGTLNLRVKDFTAAEPTVKYRGIFINDEDWGLLRWAKRNFEKEHGNIGPKTYNKVCELLLRLKANYLCPAMHAGSTAFNKIAQNKLVADSFAIVMGSVHCEPLLFNNASEWDKKSMGAWDYVTNKQTIDSVLRQRVTENSPYENVYTLALRGLHDAAMSGGSNMKERARILGEALNDQRQILADVIRKPLTEIPQAFTPYKEVLDLYDAGLELPDEVTIIWPDDNYGYMKRLCSPREQKRAGRSGVYYHVSYLGKPHDFLWMGTNPPALMYEELRKAYDTTADRVWLLNAGDIKSCELSVDLFLAMAYDIHAFHYDNVHLYPARRLAQFFGSTYYDVLAEIMSEFYRQAFLRKPEHMGWGYQWANNVKGGREQNSDTDFSFAHYNEANRRLAAYTRIGAKADSLLRCLPESAQAGFYELLYYPVKGCEWMNKMILYGQKNRAYAFQQRAATAQLAQQSKACYDSLQLITNRYNALLNGKWDPVMTTRQGFAASYYELPKLDTLSLPQSAKLGVWAEGEELTSGERAYTQLPTFSSYLRQSHRFDIYNKGQQPLKWRLKPSAAWIRTDRQRGQTDTEAQITVSIDWSRVLVGACVEGSIEVDAGTAGKKRVYLSVFNPSAPSADELSGLYVETNGYVSIPAAGFHRKVENKEIRMHVIPDLGCEGSAVQLGNPVARKQNTASEKVPRLEYDFYTFGRGSVDVYTYILPTFSLYTDKEYAGHEGTNAETRYGVRIDDGAIMNPSTSSFEWAQIWYESVLKNCRINKTTLYVDRPGKHTLKILCGDAGTVVQKVVIDLGGMKRSYMGPLPTLVK
jgi:hypothetical protein